jgi:hypothetical protein
LVERLFEQEIPEIAEGVITIKAIFPGARDSAARSRSTVSTRRSIAVWSLRWVSEAIESNQSLKNWVESESILFASTKTLKISIEKFLG